MSAAFAHVRALPAPHRTVIAVGTVVVVAGIVYTLWPAPVTKEVAAPAKDAPDAAGKSSSSSTGEVSESSSSSEEKEAKASGAKPEKDFKLAHGARTCGNDLFKKEMYAEAVAKYTEAIDVSPPENKDAAKYYSNRAACYAKLKQWDHVISDCTAAIAIDSQYMRAYTRRGRAHEQLGNYNSALNDYAIVGATEQERIEKDPKAARKMDQETTKSIEVLLEKIGEDLADKRMKEHKGSFHSKKLMASYIDTFEGPHKATFEGVDLKALRNKTGKDADEWFTLGRLLLVNKEYTDAFKAFGESMEQELTLRTTLEYAMLQHLAGSEDEAIQLLETALGRVGDRTQWKEPPELDTREKAEALVKLANIRFLKDGPEGEWESIFADALAADPEFGVVHFHLAQTYCHLTTNQSLNLQKAADHLTQCLALEGVDEYLVLCTLQGCYIACPGLEAKALAAYQKAIALQPRKAEAFNVRGQWLQTTGQFDEAVAEFEKAIAADPKSGIAYSNKGFILLTQSAQRAEQGQVSEQAQMDSMLAASKLYHQAISVDPECLEAHINLAMLFVQIHQIDNAIKSYDTAISISTNKRDLATIYGFREAARMRKKLMDGR